MSVFASGLGEIRLPTATLRVLQAGRGDHTLVFATDPPNVVEHYRDLAARLAPHFRVVVFELPGFGFSQAHAGYAHRLEDVVRVTRELVSVLELEPAILCYPCVSAYAAIRTAARHPGLVEGLVLMQAPAWSAERAWVDRVDRGRALRRPVVGALASRFLKARIARAWYDAALPPGVDRAPFVAPAVRAFSRGARFPLAQAFRAFEREGTPDLRGATQPALLVWGDADRTHRKDDPAGLRDVLPQAEVVRLPGAGHFPELEAPERFAAEVLSWAARAGFS